MSIGSARRHRQREPRVKGPDSDVTGRRDAVDYFSVNFSIQRLDTSSNASVLCVTLTIFSANIDSCSRARGDDEPANRFRYAQFHRPRSGILYGICGGCAPVPRDDRLTHSPLSLLGRGHVEDVTLIPRVRFIVRLYVYGELLYKWTGVSERLKKKKKGRRH